jgi:hypothetical protein
MLPPWAIRHPARIMLAHGTRALPVNADGTA